MSLSPLEIWAAIWGGALILFLLFVAFDHVVWQAQQWIARHQREALMVHRLRKEIHQADRDKRSVLQ